MNNPAIVDDLQLIAAWHSPGGRTPEKPMPSRHRTCRDAATEIARLRARVEELEGVGRSLGRAAGALVIATDGVDAMRPERIDVLNALKRTDAALHPTDEESRDG